MSIYQQGDVLLLRKDLSKEGAEALPKDPRGLVLAEGETSFHTHQVFGRNAKLFQYKDSAQRFLTVAKSGATVRVVGGEVNGVPRHEPIKLPGGTCRVPCLLNTNLVRAASERVAD